MNKRFLLMIILFLPTVVFSEQRISVKEGVETQVPISIHSLNQIAVENDRIMTVKGSSGRFQLDKDEVLGHLYIQPEHEAKDPIHLFLTTENQVSLSLLLIPSDIPQASITLVLQDKKIASQFEQSQPYEVVVASLVKAMETQEPLEGYAIEEVHLKTKAPKGLEVLHLQTYRGERLRGEVLQLKNTQKEAVKLMEADFYKPGVRAVALSSESLAPGDAIQVYLVRDNGSRD